MSDYEPLDLSTVYNAGPDAHPSGDPKRGLQQYHGLPFQIGPGGDAPCYIRLGGSDSVAQEPVSVPVGQTACYVLIAHAMTESGLHEGVPPGRTVATYAFVYEDGERVEAPVRERFEIGVWSVGWGELPFIAVPDCPDSMFEDRYSGPWGQTGQRQTEAGQAWPSHYYLWAWKNPRPDAPLSAIEIRPASSDAPISQFPDSPISPYMPSFLVAAVTLSHLEEEPFCREAGLPVKLTLTDEEAANARFDLSVTVDRGIATYPYPLPQADTDAFLADPMKGFGEHPSRKNSPAYVEIAANPSATVTIKRGEETVGSANWGEVKAKGAADAGKARVELLDTGRNWVHTTVLDDETGKPIPCRVHFRSPQGVPYAPHGHHPHVFSDLNTWHIDVGGDVRLGQISYAYTDGKCQGWLPRGEVLVDVARGYEYEPLRAKIEIQPGQRELTLRLKPAHHLNRDRYFSGDTHVHFLSSQGAVMEAAGEDLDVVNLLLSQWGHLFTNTEEFTGRPLASGDGETLVYATQENRQHLLGHLTLLGLKEPVMPWCSDGPSEAELGGNLETTLSHWADECHRQGGTVVIPHLPNPNGEPATLIATGRADAVEMLVHNPFFHLEYYRYLNGGYRLPLAGGTDKMDSGVPVGLYRTYAYIPPDEPFTYDNWLKALRSGNTFLSGGPILRFTVDGQPIGSTITLGKDGGTVEVEAVASSIFPIHTLQIVQGGQVVASTEEEKGTRELRLRTRLKVDGTTWLCARCAGPNYTAHNHHDSWSRGIMAHTSPIYLACGGSYDLFSPETAHYMLTLIDGSLQHIRNRARQWEPGTTTHHHGHQDHQEFLESPFHEAAAALHKRMHEKGIPH